MSSLTVTIAGNSVPIIESSLQITSRVDDKDKCNFNVLDTSGTAVYQKGQPVTVVDSNLGTLFSGYVNKPTARKLYPNPHQMWTIDCVNQFYNVVKKASKKRYRKRTGAGYKAGAIAADQIQRYLAPDGVVGNFSLSWTEQQNEWQAATLNGTVAATNLTGGNPQGADLELASGGSQVTVTGPGAGFVLGNGLLLTGYASSGYSAAYTNRQIWSGSLTIASTSDQFQYDVWVSSSSPAIKAGCDFVCSDGTIFSTSAATDLQFLGPSLATDLSGLANDTWYTRDFPTIPAALVGKTIVSVLVGLNSAAVGTYTAYFRRIKYLSGGVTTTFFGDSSTLPINVQANNLGYTNVSLTPVSVEDKKIVVTHSGLAIGAAGIVQSSQMIWTQALPNGATGIRETSIDNGATWQQMTSGSAVPNLLPGMVVTGRSVLYRDTFVVGTDPTSNIGFSGPTLLVNPAYSSTKADLITTYTTANDFNTGTLTNLMTVGSGTTPAITLNGVQRTWDDGFFSNQPQFGTSSPFQQVENKQMVLQTGTGTDIRSQLLFAGQWQNFTAEVDVLLPSANMQCGLVYRTTTWVNANDTYAYVAIVETNQIQLAHGSNSGTGAFTSIQSVPISLTVNTMHRLKIVVSGNTHQLYLDGVLLINVTDSTYPNTGYIGLRLWNGTGSTVTGIFDNFGVCAALSGTWQSPSINIAGPGTYGNSMVQWDVDGLPDSTTSITAQTSIDGGTTWQNVINGGAISGLVAGQSLTGKTLLLKLTLTASNAPIVPVLNGVTAWVMGQYSSSGYRSNAPLLNDTMTRGNVASGFGTTTDGQTYAQTGTGTTNLTSNEAQIANTTGDVHMVGGSNTGGDTNATVRFALSASTITAGIELRYKDANDFYRFSASTTTLSLLKKSAGISITLAMTSMALTPGVFYRMRFQVIGNGVAAPITLQGRVWPDGTTEPTTWSITASD